jgi:hypothetical protein
MMRLWHWQWQRALSSKWAAPGSQWQVPRQPHRFLTVPNDMLPTACLPAFASAQAQSAPTFALVHVNVVPMDQRPRDL